MLNKRLCERIAALRGTRNLDYPFDMFRILRSVRLALHLAQPFIQHFQSPDQDRREPLGKIDLHCIPQASFWRVTIQSAW